MILIIYDNQCYFCTQLAHWVQKGTQGNVKLISHQEFIGDLPEGCLLEEYDQQAMSALWAWDGMRLFRDQEAWQLLVESHPKLTSLNWLASKLNLQSQVAQSFSIGGRALRAFCSSCSARKNQERRKQRK